MKVLIVGGGGREHAIAHALSKSKKLTELFCAPGNGGIEKLARCVPISAMDFNGLINFAKQNEIDLTVVGMDEPLVGGIADAFEAHGLRVFGPGKNAAILEGSKVFSKNLMMKYGIPTASYECFDNYDEALCYIKGRKMPVVIKADGLALGKGVLICNNLNEAVAALRIQMINKKFGDSGKRVVIEEFMTGTEVSLLSFCDGKTVVPMASAQDYKRARDDDKGPNTGGMGSISPSPALTDSLMEEIYNTICLPTVDALIKEGREFKGVIYFGLMLTEDGPKVVEYNARFGDPETQAILPRLKTDLLDILMAVVDGNLDKIKIEWDDDSVCCVVMASGGYPDTYATGYRIKGIEEAEKTAIVYHAGTKTVEDGLDTNGGRVLGIVGKGQDMETARKAAYEAVDKIDFENKYFRTDIGARK